jgi:hypothetical protein
MISQFEKILPEDFKQFRDIASKFQEIDLTNINGLQELTIDSWLLATRWSEIQSNAVKIASDYGVNKTDFSTWAYQKYRQLQEMHITCRSWHRSAKEDYRANQMMEVQV